MAASTVPDTVRRLIADSIDSIAELEALLLVREHQRPWSTEEAGARLYVSLPVATYTLHTLAARGFVSQRANTFRYAPASAELDRAVASLAEAYSQNLVAVTHLVHGKPVPSVLAFARAFRIRKEP